MGIQRIEVYDHDFRSVAAGIGIPCGIYDLQDNPGTLFVGTTHDTPHFAIDNLARWWRYDGRDRYPTPPAHPRRRQQQPPSATAPGNTSCNTASATGADST